MERANALKLLPACCLLIAGSTTFPDRRCPRRSAPLFALLSKRKTRPYPDGALRGLSG